MTSSASPDRGAFDLVLEGGLLVLPDGARQASLAIQGERIAAIVPPDERPSARQVVSTDGLVVLPGLIDMHVHFREPGQTHKETFETGTSAAAVGGFTTVADMPNTMPPTTTAARLREKRSLLTGRAWVDVALWGGAGSGGSIEELAAAGAIGIKVYLGLEEAGSRHADAPADLVVADDAALVDILEQAGAVDLVVAVHCGNRALRERTRSAWEGRSFVELRDSIRTESQLHKVEAVARVLLLADAVATPVHIVHVPAPALPAIRRAKERGQAVTAEAALPFMTHSQLDTIAELGFDRYRSDSDARELWAAAVDETIDVLATDHAPHTMDEKRKGRTDLLAAPSGYPELDTALPMLLDAVHHEILPLGRLVELLGPAPASILGLDAKGSIAVGNDADLVLVDLDREDVVDARRLKTKARWSPFEGRRLVGWPVATMVGGRFVTRDGALLGDPRGRFVTGSGATNRSEDPRGSPR